MSEQEAAEVMPVISVAPKRRGRLVRGIVSPLILILIAVAVLIVHEIEPQRPKKSPEPLAVAAKLPAAAKPAPPAAKLAETRPAAPKPEAWDAIQREADAQKAARDRDKALKAQAEEKLVNAPPPPNRFDLFPNLPRGRQFPGQIRADAMARQLQAMQDEQFRRLNEMVAAHRRQQEQMFEPFARPLPGFLPPMPMPMPNFAPMPGPGAGGGGQPRVEQRSGEEVRDGVRIRWHTTIISGS